MVALDDAEVGVDDDDAGGDVLDEGGALAFEALAQEGVAHGGLGLAGDHRGGEVAARLVAAGAAVELVGVGVLADGGEGLAEHGLVGPGVVGAGVVGRDGADDAHGDLAPDARARGAGQFARADNGVERRAAGAHGGAVHAAAVAGERLDEDERARGRVGNPADAVDVGEARRGKEARLRPGGVAERVVHAALEGVEAALLGRPERELGLGRWRDEEPARREKLGEVGEGAGEVQDVGVAVGLVLLGRAGAEEDDGGLAPEGAAQRLGVRLDGRVERRDARRQLRVVLADVVDGGGAGRRDPEAGGMLAQEGGRRGRDNLRAVGRLGDAREADGAQRGGEPAERPVGERRDEARGDAGVDRAAALEQAREAVDVAPDALGAGGADADAFAAGDARAGDDGGVAVLDADGLGVAVPDALVAVLALVLEGEDGGLHGAGGGRVAGC